MFNHIKLTNNQVIATFLPGFADDARNFMRNWNNAASMYGPSAVLVRSHERSI